MFDELKDGWKNQPAHNLPNIEELKTSIGKDRNNLRRKLTMGIAALVLTILTGIVLWITIPFAFLSTKVAFALMAIAIVGGIAYMLYLQHLLPNTIDNSKPGQDFTKDWIAYRKKTKHYATKFMAAYSILLTIGLGLYFYEVTNGWPEKESVMNWGIRSTDELAKEHQNRKSFWEQYFDEYMKYDFDYFNPDLYANPNALPIGDGTGICVWDGKMCIVDEDGEAGPWARQEFNLLEAIELVNQQLDKGSDDSNFERDKKTNRIRTYMSFKY